MAANASRPVTHPPLFYAPIVDLSALDRDRAWREDLRLSREIDPLEVYFVKYPENFPSERRR